MIKNSLFSVVGYFITVLAAFLIAPITIHSLGDTRYGTWSLVAELVGYYGLLDLGIRGAVTRFVARASAQQCQDDIKETVASAFWLLVPCGLLAFFIGVTLTIALPFLFEVSNADANEAQVAMLIMSFLVAGSLPMNSLGGALIGRERFDIATSLEIVNRIVTTVSYYYVLNKGGGLVALASVQAATRVISWVFTFVAYKSVFGELKITPSWVRARRVRELMAFGTRNAIGEFALLVIYRIDLTVVAASAGLAQVTYYAIASSLVSYASTLCSQFTRVFTPRFARLESSGQNSDLQTLYLLGFRVIGMIVVGLCAGLLIFGKDFIRLWVGVEYVSGAWQNRSDVILTILLLANLPRMLQSISWQRLFGTGRVRFLMWLNICEAFANLILSVVLSHHFGAAGVAMGTFFPLMLTHVIVMPVYSSRAFGLTLRVFVSRGLATPFFTGFLMLAINYACISIAPPLTWATFFTEVAVAITLCAFVCTLFGFTRAERSNLLAAFGWQRVIWFLR